MEKLNKVATPELIQNVAEQLHENWRAPRKLKRKFKQRVKIQALLSDGRTKWYNKGDVPQDAEILKSQDIANTDFADLDPQWQAENKAAAEFVVPAVMQVLGDDTSISISQTTDLADQVHQAWISRNDWVNHPEYGNPEMAGPYSELSEKLQYEDLKHVLTTLTVVGSTIEVTSKEVQIPENITHNFMLLPGVEVKISQPNYHNDGTGEVIVTIQDPEARRDFYKKQDQNTIYGQSRETFRTKVRSTRQLAVIVNKLLSEILKG